jgi:hypothetical protein
VYPAFHHDVAPRYCVVDAIELTSAAGSYVAAPALEATHAAATPHAATSRTVHVSFLAAIDLLARNAQAAVPETGRPYEARGTSESPE